MSEHKVRMYICNALTAVTMYINPATGQQQSDDCDCPHR